jgi:sialidase-1
MIRKTYETNIYENPKPAVRSLQAAFPGLALLPSNEIIALFVIGEAFEAANTRAYISRSLDIGKTWQLQGQLYNQQELGLGYQFSDYYKPTLLKDGSLVAVGYGFERHDPDKGIGDSETGAFLPGQNIVTFSTDNGRTWSIPKKIDIGSDEVLELSGPCIQLNSGKLISAGPPFSINKTNQEGWVIESSDNGKTWKHLSNYFTAPGGNVAPWETRICEMQPDRVVALFWAYDTLNEKHLSNHLTVSHDGGKTWSKAIDTDHMGQASNLLWLGGNKLLTIHSHRAGEVGLYVRYIDFSNDKWNVQEEAVIWGKASAQDTSSNIVDQFAALKFGQPSLLRLNDDEFIATHWCVENCMYKIKTHRFIFKA